MSNKNKVIKVPVEESRADRWDEAAEDQEWSRAAMIRHAVEKELAGGQDHGQVNTDSIEETLSEVTEGLRRIDSTLESLDHRLNAIEKEVKHSPDIRRLKNDVFAALPTKQDLERYKDPEEGPLPPRLPEEQGGPVAYTGLPEDIAKVLGEDTFDVVDAIEKLQENARVRVEQDEDQDRYFKEVA